MPSAVLANGPFRIIESIVLNAFNEFGLAEPILRALADENYTIPTPIQAQTIPLAMSGRDVVGIAQTGTGKTAAFALPILHRLLANRHRPAQKTCRVLVLSPTRELSGQIGDSFRTYGRHIRPLDVALTIGGVPINRQKRDLARGVEVLVATPGRLLDLVQERAVQLNAIEVLVLDEADRMLDMGFIHDIKRIVALLPKQRQTLFFSATMPQQIADLAGQMLRDPARVAVTPQASTAERVSQRVIHTDRATKPSLLAEIIKTEKIDRVLVFTRTKHGADKVVRGLEKAGLRAGAIHGNKSQNNRERALAAFRDGSVRTLVATDIAARGIDVDGISHVINYDLPNIPESYVHRIGRTARAGADGIAISFCDHEERAFLRDIERLIRTAIPATDRRGERQEPASHASGDEPRQQREGGHRNGRSRRGRAHARPQSGNGHHAAQNGTRNERPQNGNRHQAAPNGGRNERPRNHGQAKPAHNGQAKPAQQQHGRRDQTQRSDGSIGNVAFMQRQSRREERRS